MEKPLVFRVLFLRQLVPLVGVALFGALLFTAPITATWGQTRWGVLGAIVTVAIVRYMSDVWRKAAVLLNEDGLRIYAGRTPQFWPYEKLLKVKQVGRYRVRMCFDIPNDDNTHRHLTADLWRSDAFAAALLDRYAAHQGEELDGAAGDEAA